MGWPNRRVTYYNAQRENPGRKLGIKLCGMASDARNRLSQLRIVLDDLKCENNVVSFSTKKLSNDFIRIMNDLENEMNEDYKTTGFSLIGNKVIIYFWNTAVPGYNNLVAASEFFKTLRQN